MINIKSSAITALLLWPLAACNTETLSKSDADSVSSRTSPPNLIILYVDDLGYGDIGSNGAVGVETPNINQLAARGVSFTDAHSSAATCTPSRYSLLTGEHGFRNKAAILRGDAPALIKPGKATLPAMLKKAGYATGVVGKWHLGLGNGNINWNSEIKPGPLEIGFDYSFLLPATGDRVPTVYLENHRIVGLDPVDPITVSYKKDLGHRPTGISYPELLSMKADLQHSGSIINGVSRIGTMAGGESALWLDEEFPDVLTEKAISFIRKNQSRPFFLFHSFHDIHVPRLPHPRFKGKSSMGPRGDAIAQVDWMTGEIVKELVTLGISDNTIIIFTSDNGPVLNDGYEDMAKELLGKHRPSGPFRGGKYSAFEAGTRMPMIVSWPGKVVSSESSALISQMDIYASMAKLVGVDLQQDEAVDSVELLDVLLGKSMQGRDYLVEESVGSLALRANDWKYIAPYKSKILPSFVKKKGIESGLDFEPQLYHLAKDIGEQHNIASANPEVVTRLAKKLGQIKEVGY